MVIVTTEDGTVYTGDRVIVTFSLGVFQNEVVASGISHHCRAVASLTVPGGQEFHFPHFFLKFRLIFLIFPQTLLIFFLILALRVGESPTWEGPGYATAPLPYWKKHILPQMSGTYYTAIFLNFAESDAETIMNVHERYNFYPAFFSFDIFESQQNRFPDNHILTTHILGDEALRIDQQSDADTKAEIEAVLQKMYGLEEEPPVATDFLIYSWVKDSTFGGVLQLAS